MSFGALRTVRNHRGRQVRLARPVVFTAEMAKNDATHSNGSPEEAALAKFDRLEHTTSIAVWDVPAPVVIRRRSNVKVGVSGAEKCCLAGGSVAILNDVGVRVATAQLGSVGLAGTKALYWTEVEIPEVIAEGPHDWSAEFLPPEASLRAIVHRPSSFRFNFRAVKSPEHRVTVRIAEEKTGNPLDGVEMRLGVYRARSENGVATFEVAAGTYELCFWKTGHNIASVPVAVNGNITIEVALSKAAAVVEPYWM